MLRKKPTRIEYTESDIEEIGKKSLGDRTKKENKDVKEDDEAVATKHEERLRTYKESNQ